MGKSRGTTEQLKALDNFQRAEFLKRRGIHSECVSRISEMRKRTCALNQKMTTDAEFYEKANSWFWLTAVAAIVLEAIFHFLSNRIETEVVILVLMIWGFGFLMRRINGNHDRLMFEMLALEIDRYDFELQINSGLISSSLNDDEDEALTRSILESIGFDSGLIGSAAKMYPLDANQ
jgi:hypothetical protein